MHTLHWLRAWEDIRNVHVSFPAPNIAWNISQTSQTFSTNIITFYMYTIQYSSFLSKRLKEEKERKDKQTNR